MRSCKFILASNSNNESSPKVYKLAPGNTENEEQLDPYKCSPNEKLIINGNGGGTGSVGCDSSIKDDSPRSVNRLEPPTDPFRIEDHEDSQNLVEDLKNEKAQPGEAD
jgi:hypothetical protein